MRETVKIPKGKFPKTRYRWMRNPATRVKDSVKKYNRSKERTRARKEIYEKD